MQSYSAISSIIEILDFISENCRGNTIFWGFRQVPTQTRLYSHRRWLKISDLLRKKRDCSLYYLCSKNKGADLAYRAADLPLCFAKSRFSHDTVKHTVGQVLVRLKTSFFLSRQQTIKIRTSKLSSG